MIRLDGPHVSPVVAAQRLAGHYGRFLLDSGSDLDQCGRWSFVGADPLEVLRDGPGDPLAMLERWTAAPAEGPEPVPVAVGYLGYEFGKRLWLERSSHRAEAEVGDLWFGRYGAVWRFDRTTRRGAVVGHDEDAAERLRAALESRRPSPLAGRFGRLRPENDPVQHIRSIERVLEYIRAGDVYQVNLARRLRARAIDAADPLWLYERVASLSPAPFGALIETGSHAVLSNSPELFLRRAPGSSILETRPIKGTRARGATEASDRALIAELATDAKERAEHLMIVDLERNDLGRVAETGSVAVSGFARTITLPNVHHLVSTVSCRLREGTSLGDLFRATFPGGSITGAPKLRAMEIIDELEPFRRGVYTGAIGYVGAGGAIDLAIAIRTGILAGGMLTLYVGGGIVADSNPARELEETEEKAAAWKKALEK